jgi:hypothetical protein
MMAALVMETFLHSASENCSINDLQEKSEQFNMDFQPALLKSRLFSTPITPWLPMRYGGTREPPHMMVPMARILNVF